MPDKSIRSIDQLEDVQEMVDLVQKLDKEQKKIALAALRGAVLIADAEAEKKGA